MLFSRYRFVPGLAENLARAGLTRPTDIQYRAIPAVLAGNDLMAIAQTGTGKTLAFALPLIQLLAARGKPKESYAPRGLILVPTHELAQQIYLVLKQMTQGLEVASFCLTGGYTREAQMDTLPKDVDLVVATPGRMRDLACNGYVTLARIRYLVLDEADRMLDYGFRPDIDWLCHRLPPMPQTLFFSATISPEIKRLAHRIVRNPIRIEIAPDNPVNNNIAHSVLPVPAAEKRFFLERLVRQNPEKKILVFVRTKVRVARVQAAMARVAIESAQLHGGLDRQARQAALAAFSEGQVKLLIATDLSARGLDIPRVDMVVNYDLPTQPEVYIHRIGRTGRGRLKGLAISFYDEQERPLLESIEQHLGGPLPRVRLDSQERADTVDFSAAQDSDWRSLLKAQQAREVERAGKRKGRSKR